ncbi:glycosyltransferase [Methylotenera sp.]|uniref:glycosyltransferase n=1 Tax=Methylotenera sp. TaxID=2051956 RepID=UPI00272F9B80|nr:glycosyltransferase [Methylotenera sp.]MDP2231489.1 glycosyltransferase [Methylotenera sp.]
MKILLSAFACKPNSGSETGVGWRWAIELAKTHEVVVLTDMTRKTAIEQELMLHPLENLLVVFYRPVWLKWVPLNSTTAQFLYSAWQYSLLPFARHLHKEKKFDLIIHLTYGVFRHPSFLGFVGPAFVFGPVGGGEDAPWGLKYSLPVKEKVKELLRSLLNGLATYNPFLRIALGRASLILAKTEDTRCALPPSMQNKTIVCSEIGIDKHTLKYEQDFNCRDVDLPLQVLFAGRMLGWKGAHFAIMAVAKALGRGHRIHLTMVGSGPLLPWLKSLAIKLGIDNHVTWIGQIPQQDLFVLYERMHCFLFPSLHDSSGNVVLEALSFGLPVICLDVGGPVTIVNLKCARVISTKGKTEAILVEVIADEVGYIATNECARQNMALEAISRARSMTWEKQIERNMLLIQIRLGL